MKQRITFELGEAGAAITKRAAASLSLTVVDVGDRGRFYVELEDPIDAYRLAERTAGDPAWAGLFLPGGRGV